jgi:hypothetical protein
MRKQTIMSIKNSGIAVSESGRSRFTPIHLAVAIVVGLLCLTPHFTYGDGRHQFLAITFVVLLGVFCGSGAGQQRAVPVAIVAAGYALIWAATNIVAAQLRPDLVATPAIWLWLTLLVFIGWTVTALLAGTAVTRSQKGDRG